MIKPLCILACFSRKNFDKFFFPQIFFYLHVEDNVQLEDLKLNVWKRKYTETKLWVLKKLLFSRSDA